MKILQNNNDRTILINSETNFGTDLGWEESFQEYEHETLKSIINPVENFETVRYIHSGYTSDLGINQHDIWHEFYFANSVGVHSGGLNYEHIGLKPENNYNLTKTENSSFFRLEFYKVPAGETPNSKNRKLVFTKQLPIPMGEQVYYTPINQKVFVPVFSGSNYRNSENMFLYWFQDDTVLEGTLLSGNTFYMCSKFYNTIDGTSIAFMNKDKDLSTTINEEEDMYRKMVISRDNYSYVIYTGITEDHRGGTSGVGSPLRWYATQVSNEIGGLPVRYLFQRTSNTPSYTAADACSAPLYSGSYYYLSESVPAVGVDVYTEPYETTLAAGTTGVVYRFDNGGSITYAFSIGVSGAIDYVGRCVSQYQRTSNTLSYTTVDACSSPSYSGPYLYLAEDPAIGVTVYSDDEGTTEYGGTTGIVSRYENGGTTRYAFSIGTNSQIDVIGICTDQYQMTANGSYTTSTLACAAPLYSGTYLYFENTPAVGIDVYTDSDATTKYAGTGGNYIRVNDGGVISYAIRVDSSGIIDDVSICTYEFQRTSNTVSYTIPDTCDDPAYSGGYYYLSESTPSVGTIVYTSSDATTKATGTTGIVYRMENGGEIIYAFSIAVDGTIDVVGICRDEYQITSNGPFYTSTDACNAGVYSGSYYYFEDTPAIGVIVYANSTGTTRASGTTGIYQRIEMMGGGTIYVISIAVDGTIDGIGTC